MYFGIANAQSRVEGIQIAKLALRLEAVVNWSVALFAAVIALISLGYTFLAYPQTDDLERSGALRVFSMLQRIQSDLRGIEGRWAACLVQYPAYMGGHIIGRYPALLIALMVIGAFACCCVVALITGRRISERNVVLSGIGAYSFLWLGTPFGEEFYWYPAAIEEWTNIAVGMIMLWLLFSFEAMWSRILVAALAFALPATQEVFGGWIVGVLAAICLVRFTTGRKTGTVAMATLASILGTASNLLMPGVRARASDSAHQSLHDALIQAIHVERVIFSHWAATLPVLILILLSAARMRSRPSWYAKAPLLTKVLLLLAIVAVPFTVITMTSYALGGAVQRHVYDGFFILLCAAIAAFAAVCGFNIGQWNAAKVFLETPWSSLLRSAVMIMAVAGAMSLPRFHATFQDIDPAIRNRAVWLQRNAEILAKVNAGVRDVVVEQRMLPLTILSSSLDITEDPKWYANQHMATYYGLQSIRLSPPELSADRATKDSAAAAVH